MALPDALQNAALRLPSAAARLAGVPGSGLPLDDEEAEQVEIMLVAVKDAFGNDRDAAGSSVVDALLADDPLRLALLRLVAFAVRAGQQCPGPFSRVAASALIASAFLLDIENPTARRTRTQFDFARKLLRTHTLQSCSRAFSAAVVAVEAVADAGEGPDRTEEVPAGPGGGGAVAGAALAAAGPQAQPTISLLMLNSSCSLVNSMLLLSLWDINDAGQLQQFSEQQQLYARELAAALRDSCVLEHAARWALHMQLAEAGGRVLDCTMDVPVSVVILELEHTDRLAFRLDDGVAPPVLHEALSGPCVRHLALSMGLAVLCAADGGPSHGLQPALLLRLPILGLEGEDLRGGHGIQQLEAWVFTAMVRALENSAAAPATPPCGWRTMVGLLRRIGSLVLASARAWADEEAVGEAEAVAVGEAGPTPPPQQLVLRTADTMGVAVLALHHLQRLLRDQDQIAAAAVAPTALAEAEAAWWRLAVDVATHCARWASADGRNTLVELLSFPLWSLQTDGLLPAAPPPALSAALAGGLLPLWERLLRCAGRDMDCAEAPLLYCMLDNFANPWGYWRLLAYGEPHQAAALVATWGKLLRALAVPRLLWSAGTEAAGLLTQHTALACGLVSCAGRMLDAAIDRLAASAGRGDAEASAPEQQLTRLISCAACDWLPPLARLARAGLPSVQRATLTEQPFSDSMRQILVRAHALPAWLRVLARRVGSGLGQAAEAAAEGASAATPTATADEAGWRQLLLQEVGAVTLLGAVCHHVGWMKCAALSYKEMAIGLPVLLSSCCSVTAACPGEVRQAVLAAAADAAAAGASRGAGQGFASGGGRQRGGRSTSRRGGGGGLNRSAAAAPPGWSPQLLRLVAAELDPRPGNERISSAAFALARQAEQWVAGSGKDCAELAAAVAALSPEPDVDTAAGALVPSPAEARVLLRTCANLACDNLAGDSEADLPLRACGRCGGAWYCRQECQAAHWRSGHREACRGRSMAAAGTVRVGQAASEASAP